MGQPIGATGPVEFGEFEVIETCFRPLAGAGAFDLTDDAAMLAPPPGHDLVLTADAIACGVHFFADDPPDLIARKALRVNLSDLAAKGATPLCYLLAAAFPAPFDKTWIAAFASGLAADQAEFGISLSGGDTIRVAAGSSGPTISITAIGAVPTGTMVRRAGGQPGDHLFVTGEIGGAAAGLACLLGETSLIGDLSGAERAVAIERYHLPRPRCGLANTVRAHASAAIDISDGLVGDCDKLAVASGCSATIDANTVPLHGALSGNGASADIVAAAITGGDDFEILAAIPPGQIAPFTAAAADVGIGVTDIGMLGEAGDSPAPISVLLDNQPLRLPRRSYVHSRAGDHERAGDPGSDGN